jgi:hypothetical protein
VTDELPPRPDEGTEVPILAVPRRRSPWTAIAVIVVSVVTLIVLIAIAVNAMLDSQQQQVENLFQGVQYCIDHPKDPTCNFTVAPSP